MDSEIGLLVLELAPPRSLGGLGGEARRSIYHQDIS
jgi:hypothetical protein